jgi:hypothetical protein
MTTTEQDTNMRAATGTAVATRPRAKATSPAKGGGHHERAARRAVEANSTHLDFALGEVQVHVVMPPLDKLAFYAGLAGAAAFGVIEWPIAVLTGVGHLLSDDRRNRTLRALGEALDAAV